MLETLRDDNTTVLEDVNPRKIFIVLDMGATHKGLNFIGMRMWALFKILSNDLDFYSDNNC